MSLSSALAIAGSVPGFGGGHEHVPPNVEALDDLDIELVVRLVVHDLPHLHAQPRAQHAVPLVYAQERLAAV